MELPFTLETDLEKSIAADPEWQEGVVWGKPRFGHMEGPIMYHIADVLKNIDHQCPPENERANLRLIALVHDSFKYRVDESRPKIGTNHHAYIARKFAQRYIHDPVLLDIIDAEERVEHLLERLETSLPLYLHFFYADSATESKNPAPVAWFDEFLLSKGFSEEFIKQPHG
jgi:hypothetical protein